MTIFAISSDSNNQALKNKLKDTFGEEDFFEVDKYLCLVSTEKTLTTEDVFQKISGDNPLTDVYGSYIVFSVNSYYGYHTKTVWEWMQAKGV